MPENEIPPFYRGIFIVILVCVSVFLAEKGENPLSLSHRIEKEHHRSGVRKGYSPLVKIPTPFA